VAIARAIRVSLARMIRDSCGHRGPIDHVMVRRSVRGVLAEGTTLTCAVVMAWKYYQAADQVG
jgi:hypothetical protein